VAHFVNSSSPSGQFKPATVKIQNVAMRLGWKWTHSSQ
jgi:hypothetical protein